MKVVHLRRNFVWTEWKSRHIGMQLYLNTDHICHKIILAIAANNSRFNPNHESHSFPPNIRISVYKNEHILAAVMEYMQL
jgi:hypothetical protein